MDFLQEAQTILPELSAVRQTLHQNPELGNQETQTAALVESFLRACGIAVERPFGTAVVGTLHGGLPGKTVALRADMDALPIEEQSGAPFSSHVSGRMHACGHDVHTAALLGAAKLLSRIRDTLHGSVRFLFEPDEEGSGGARRLIEAGCMQDVGAVFGAHVSPELPIGAVGIRYGKFYAASDTFHVTVHGKSCHGAEPEKGIDALRTAAEMVTALHTLPSRYASARCVLSVGTLQAGSAINVIADRAVFSGILRTLGPQDRQSMKTHLQQTLRQIAEKSGAIADIQLHESYCGIVNTDDAAALVEQVARRLLPESLVRILQEPTMTTEDFGYLIEAAGSGAFYHIGAGCAQPLHSPHFLPNEQAICTAAALHAAVAARYLSLG